MMAPIRVLILGGHGKVSLLLTKLLVKEEGWHVSSVIRNADQRDEIIELGKGQKGEVDVVVESLEDVRSVDQAKQVLTKANPSYVVFSAGAGGKGGPSRTYAIDRDAAKHYIKAALEMPSITKFLMVSFIASRKNRAPWWTDEDWKSAQHVCNEVLPDYYKAKVEADEYLAALAKKRNEKDSQFQAINLRPGSLTDNPATGKVLMGKTPSRGVVCRADVATAVAALLKKNDVTRWIDLLEGDVEIDTAVDHIIKDKVDCIEGEDLDRIYALTG